MIDPKDQQRHVGRVSLAMIAFLTVVFVILTYRLFVPMLINAHNDGATILAVLLAFAGLAVPYLVWSLFLRPAFLIIEEKENNDEA